MTTIAAYILAIAAVAFMVAAARLMRPRVGDTVWMIYGVYDPNGPVARRPATTGVVARYDHGVAWVFIPDEGTYWDVDRRDMYRNLLSASPTWRADLSIKAELGIEDEVAP
jgi:hypothetical protein